MSVSEPNIEPTGTVPPTLEAQALQALLGVLSSSTSPAVLEAQAIMLRRLALEGDVTGSRIPAPLNITEVGGYLNLLGALGQTDMRNQALAGALGVAGSISGVEWMSSSPTIAWLALPNDRPAGPAQGAIPVTFQVRSDFAPSLRLALQGLHDQGCALPILAPAMTLPPAGTEPPADVLPYLGREFTLVPGTALVDPDTDPLAVAELNAGPWQVVSRCLSTGPIGVTPQQWVALSCTAAACTQTPAPAAGRQYVPIAPVLASAGFTPAVTNYLPSSVTDLGWTRFVNLTGLVPGTTTLGSELSLLYSPSDIAGSSLAGRSGAVWNGSMFAGG